MQDVSNKNIVVDPPSQVSTFSEAESVASKVAKRLLQHEPFLSKPTGEEQGVLEDLYLSSAKKKLHSAFFSIDLRGFTPLSYEKSSEELSWLVSAFSYTLSHILKANGGYVLKFVGDAVLGFFPTVRLSTSVERAFFTAITTATFMDKYFLPYVGERGIRTNYGMGIDAGEVSIVKLGSPATKLSYDLIGKPINFSVKFQAMARDGALIVSEHVYQLLKDDFRSYFSEYTDYERHPSGIKRSLLDKIPLLRRVRNIERLYVAKHLTVGDL